MDDAAFMRRFQSIGKLQAQLEHFINGQRTPANVLAESLAFQQFHGDEVLALLLSDLIDSADMGVAERRRRPRFAEKPLERRLVVRDFFRKEL